MTERNSFGGIECSLSGGRAVQGARNSPDALKKLYVLVQQMCGNIEFESKDPISCVVLRCGEAVAQTKIQCGRRPLWNEVLSVSIGSLPCVAELCLEEQLEAVKSGPASRPPRLVNHARFEVMIEEPLVECFADEWVTVNMEELAAQKKIELSDAACMPKLRLACSLNYFLVEARQRGLWPTQETLEGGSTLRPCIQLPAVRPRRVVSKAVVSIPEMPSRQPAARFWQPFHQKSFRDAFDYSNDEFQLVNPTDGHQECESAGLGENIEEVQEEDEGSWDTANLVHRPATKSSTWPPGPNHAQLRQSRSFHVDHHSSSALKAGAARGAAQPRRNSCGADLEHLDAVPGHLRPSGAPARKLVPTPLGGVEGGGCGDFVPAPPDLSAEPDLSPFELGIHAQAAVGSTAPAGWRGGGGFLSPAAAAGVVTASGRSRAVRFSS